MLLKIVKNNTPVWLEAATMVEKQKREVTNVALELARVAVVVAQIYLQDAKKIIIIITGEDEGPACSFLHCSS